MADVVQAMKSMMMSNASGGLVALGCCGGRAQEEDSKGYLMESVDREGSGHSPTNPKPKRLCKRRPAKLMSSLDFSLES